MALPPHIVRSPASLGLDESTRPELVDFGAKNLRGENIRQFRQGEAGTRYGFTALTNTRTDATTPTAAYKLFANRDVPCRITEGPQLEVYLQALQRWKSLGRVPECGVRTIDMPTMGNALFGVGGNIEDIEYCNGYIATISQSYTEFLTPTGSSYVSLVDATTGAVIRPIEKLSDTYSYPCVASFSGRYFVALACDVASSAITAYILDTSTAATIATGWVSLATVGSNWLSPFVGSPVAICSLADRIAVAYLVSTGGASQIAVKTYNASGIIDSVVVNTSSVTPETLDLAGSNADTLWVAWNEAAACKIKGLTGTSLATVKATTATIITTAVGVSYIRISPSTTTGKGRLMVTDSTSPLRSYTRGFKTTTGAAATDGSQTTIYAVRPLARPFMYGTRHYALVAAGGTITTAQTQNNAILVDWTDDVTYLRPVANIAPGLATQSEFCACKTITTAATTKRYVAIGVARSGIATAAQLAELDFADTKRWQPVAHGNSIHMSGGMLWYSDGTRVAEAPFLVRPKQPTTANSSTGITATTGWRYACVYEEVDSDGNWYISGVSEPSASTGAVANKTVTVSTLPLTVSGRIGSTANASSLRVAFYRTADGGVAPYYRLGTTLNDTTASAITYVDTTADATLIANAKLYSQPGIVGTAQDRRAPPPLSCLVSYNGMLVGASGSDVWFSGQSVSGEGTWFNPVFQVPVPGDGDITAMWVMDGTLFVAKRRDIYAIGGEAPSDNAAIGGLGLPRRLAVDVGCIEARSPCVTALGTFFQSERGIEILTRAQTTQWIGMPIQGAIVDFPIVTSATMDPSNSGTVLIELAASQSSGLVAGSGRTLVFDLSLNEWVSTDRRKSSAGVADAPSQSACAIYTSAGYRYAWLASNGVVHYEDRTTHLDANGSFVVPLAETGWFNGFQNEQRVYRVSILFQRYTAAGLKVEVAYDYGDYAVIDDKIWTETNTLGQRQLEFSPSPRGESMKFRITTTAPLVLGTGQGIGSFGISLDLAAKQGPTKGTVRLDPALRR